MSLSDLCRRELGIVLGARVTWLVLAASALLVGHSFVLAIDLFSAASRSAAAFVLMAREMDPLAGVVRPMLGGLQLAASVLLPLIAARGLALERERRSYGALAIAVGGTTRVVAAKCLAAAVAPCLMLLPVGLSLALFVGFGGHVAARETTVALTGHWLHGLAIVAVSVAAAAATRTFAQAALLGIAVSLGSWAVDAGEGFAALAWLGRLEWVSVSERLQPFEQGVLSLGATGWLLSLTIGALAVAISAARFTDGLRRALPVLAILAVLGAALWMFGNLSRAYDASEQQRMSLPPSVIKALRALEQPIRIEVWLDRDDGRRAQFERDALAKLRLARPDLTLIYPLDGLDRPNEAARDADYGRIVLRVGKALRQTRSTSRRELITLLFEAAGRVLPDWSQPQYSGYPVVIDGWARTLLATAAYGLIPGVFLIGGWLLTRDRRRRR